MSRHELLNVGVARGLSLNSKTAIDTPTGNVDLAPTILRLLGITAYERAMDGRAISEALINETGSIPDVRTETHESQTGGYRQQVQVSHVGGARYVDWGNRV